MASLHQGQLGQPKFEIPLSAEFKIRIDIFLTEDSFGSALSKVEVIAPWKSLSSLYRVIGPDFRSHCDTQQSVHRDTIPFVTALGQGTNVHSKTYCGFELILHTHR